MRPAALIRGPSRKPSDCSVSSAGSTAATPISARSPGFCGARQRARAPRGRCGGSRRAAARGRRRSPARPGRGARRPPPGRAASQSLSTTPAAQQLRAGRSGRALRGRVHDDAVGQLVAGAVVVADDDVQPRRAGRGDLLDGGDAAVDGHQQVDAARRPAARRRRGQPVALVEAAGQLPDGVARRGRAACAGGSRWSRRRPRRSRRTRRCASRAATCSRISSAAAGTPGSVSGSWRSSAARNARASSTVAKPRRARIAPTGRDTPSPAASCSATATSYGAHDQLDGGEHPTHPVRRADGSRDAAELPARARRRPSVRPGARLAVVDPVLAVDASPYQ